MCTRRAHSFLRSHRLVSSDRQKNSRRMLAACAFLLGVAFLPTMSAIGGWLRHGYVDGVSGESEANLGVHQGGGEGSVDWENAPRVDLVCRTYGGSLHIWWNIFMPSYLVSQSSLGDTSFDDPQSFQHRAGPCTSSAHANHKLSRSGWLFCAGKCPSAPLLSTNLYVGLFPAHRVLVLPRADRARCPLYRALGVARCCMTVHISMDL